jgi:hypothetical protein
MFRKVYGESEFTCRFHDCPYHSDGFRSINDRNEHERSHMKTLRCADPTCEYFARGFTSKTGLQKHNRRYHPTPEEVELPAFEPLEPAAPPSPIVLPPAPLPRIPTPPPLDPPPTTWSSQLSSPRPQPIDEVPGPIEPIKKVRTKRGKRGLRVHDCPLCPKVISNYRLRRVR